MFMIGEKNMWFKSKTPLRKTGGSTEEHPTNVQSKLNVNEEYKEVFRTKSYMEMWSKVQVQIRRINQEKHSSCTPYSHICEISLEPKQEIAVDMIKCSSEFHQLLIDYFRGSLEAYKICGFLLQIIHQTRVNYCIIQKVINLVSSLGYYCINDQYNVIFNKLAEFAKLDNPLSRFRRLKLDAIHNEYGLLLDQLRKTRKKVTKRVKIISLLKKGLGTSNLMKNGPQVDAAAKGVYVLNRDFETLSQLVKRLDDEIEHHRWIAELCVRSHKKQMLKEVVKEFKIHESSFLELLGELEEHVYLCFVTTNRARRLVIQATTVNAQQHTRGLMEGKSQQQF